MAAGRNGSIGLDMVFKTTIWLMYLHILLSENTSRFFLKLQFNFETDDVLNTFFWVKIS
ncbi:hypothetical protein Hdeb2414_s0014g00425091 [Helianthus debilis subsp. tardiflorus]